jgi:hypothetical protein
MSERSGRSRLFALSLGIALVLWFFVSVEHRGERSEEKVIEASVTYPPLDGLVLIDPPERVKLRLRGQEAEMRGANAFSVDVRVEIPDGPAGPRDIPITPDNVRLPKGLEVVSIEPSVLRVEVDREIRRLVPVRVILEGEPAAGAVAKNPTSRPREVLISGPESRLRQLEHVETSRIRLDGHALDFEESAMLIAPDPLVRIEGSGVVSVFVPMQQPLPPSGL